MTNNLPQPHVVHLGKKSKKQIKRYRKGYGSMFNEVHGVVSQTKAEYGDEKQILPIVVVHRRKKKKSGWKMKW